MYKRIGAVLVIIGGFLNTLSVQSAPRRIYTPSKLYIRFNAVGASQDKAGTMRFWSQKEPQAGAAGASIGYRVNRFTLYEIDYLFSGKAAVLRNSVAIVRKELIPLPYPWNITLQVGGVYKLDNAVKLPLGGIGVNYMTSTFFAELGYRYYRVPDLDWFKATGVFTNETPRRVHAVILSVGRHFE